jgi:hypothetical protein
MLYLAKIVLALIVFVTVAELTKHHPKWGGLLSAMPWITLLVIVSNHQIDNVPASDIVGYLWATFWFILPTLLFVALMAGMLQRGTGFYVSLVTALIVTAFANGLVAYCLDASSSSTR